MKSKIIIAVTILLVIGSGVSVYFAIDSSNTNKELTAEIEDLKDDINSTEEDLEDSQNDIEILTEDKAVLASEKTSLTEQLEDLFRDMDDVSDSVDELQDQYDELLTVPMCPAEDYGDVDFSFSSNDDMLEELIAFAEEIWGEVLDADWTSWDEYSDTSLHSIQTEEDWEYFLVFFDNKEAGTIAGVFYVRDQCWLSLPSLEE